MIWTDDGGDPRRLIYCAAVDVTWAAGAKDAPVAPSRPIPILLPTRAWLVMTIMTMMMILLLLLLLLLLLYLYYCHCYCVSTCTVITTTMAVLATTTFPSTSTSTTNTTTIILQPFFILVLIAIGGAVGACSRYLVSEFCITYIHVQAWINVKLAKRIYHNWPFC